MAVTWPEPAIVSSRAPLIDHLIELRNRLMYAVGTLLIVFIALWQGVGSFLGNYYLAKVSMGLVQDLRVALFNNLLTLPNRYFDNEIC